MCTYHERVPSHGFHANFIEPQGSPGTTGASLSFRALVIFRGITAARKESGSDQFHQCSVTPGGNNKAGKHTWEAQRKN